MKSQNPFDLSRGDLTFAEVLHSGARAEVKRAEVKRADAKRAEVKLGSGVERDKRVPDHYKLVDMQSLHKLHDNAPLIMFAERGGAPLTYRGYFNKYIASARGGRTPGKSFIVIEFESGKRQPIPVDSVQSVYEDTVPEHAVPREVRLMRQALDATPNFQLAAVAPAAPHHAPQTASDASVTQPTIAPQTVSVSQPTIAPQPALDARVEALIRERVERALDARVQQRSTVDEAAFQLLQKRVNEFNVELQKTKSDLTRLINTVKLMSRA